MPAIAAYYVSVSACSTAATFGDHGPNHVCETRMISYAQNFEDVMIARLFDAHYRGFYVDIGAAHPDFLSVTRHFYDQGWSGINVEPTFRFYPLLCEARHRDTNLQCAIGNGPSSAALFENPDSPEKSTPNPPLPDALAA